MKKKIEVEEITIDVKNGKSIFDSTSYPKTGLFLTRDSLGVPMMISVSQTQEGVNMGVISMPIPIDTPITDVDDVTDKTPIKLGDSREKRGEWIGNQTLIDVLILFNARK